MFVVKYFRGNRTLREKEFNALEKAESYVDNNPPEQACQYEIYDTVEEEIVEEGELEANDFDNQIMDMTSFDEDEMDGFQIDTYNEDEDY